jgi:hypothetical protein
MSYGMGQAVRTAKNVRPRERLNVELVMTISFTYMKVNAYR